jgi:hypothetical protein
MLIFRGRASTFFKAWSSWATNVFLAAAEPNGNAKAVRQLSAGSQEGGRHRHCAAVSSGSDPSVTGCPAIVLVGGRGQKYELLGTSRVIACGSLAEGTFKVVDLEKQEVVSGTMHQLATAA